MISKTTYTLLLTIVFSYDLFSFSLLTDTTSNSSDKPVRIYNTIRLTTEKPMIDGKLDDECWKTGEWAGDFTQWIPNEGAKSL